MERSSGRKEGGVFFLFVFFCFFFFFLLSVSFPFCLYFLLCLLVWLALFDLACMACIVSFSWALHHTPPRDHQITMTSYIGRPKAVNSSVRSFPASSIVFDPAPLAKRESAKSSKRLQPLFSRTCVAWSIQSKPERLRP